METIITIDGAGRLVLPKPLREKMHLRKGTRLRVLDEGNHLVLQPLNEAPRLIRSGGLLVVEGRLVGPPSDHREIREARIRRLAGEGS